MMACECGSSATLRARLTASAIPYTAVRSTTLREQE
jgi:hypothetical protein